jgi:hypothetical protein
MMTALALLHAPGNAEAFLKGLEGDFEKQPLKTMSNPYEFLS